MRNLVLSVSSVLILAASPSFGQSGSAMTGAELQALLGEGATINLGGEGQGYAGTLTLSKDGTGAGEAKTDAGDVIALSGTWSIKGDTFCRAWAAIDDGKEVCETWVKTSDTSVEVYNGEAKIGVNSW